MRWTSDENEILLNPRWPLEDLDFLQRGAQKILQEKNLRGHFVLSSSGTTADSWRSVKLIFIAKAAVLRAAELVSQQFSLSSKDSLVQSLPEFHAGGLGVLARAHVSGAHLVSDLDLANVISLVPTQLYDFLKSQKKPSAHLRLVFMGGGFLAPDLEAQAREAGWPLVMTYGMTETSAMIAARAEPDSSLGLKPFPGVEGKAAADGRWKFRAPGLATGYARLNAEGFAWQEIKDSSGWFQSEDRLQIRDGRWFVEGRTSDFVKIGGESVNLSALREIFSQEVPSSLRREGAHLTLRESERLGHEIVLATEGPGFEEWAERYNRKVLPFERIRAMIDVGSLPRTELGKIREAELQKRILELKGPD